MKKGKCNHLECDNETLAYLSYCDFHHSGGVLGNGQAFEQYEIIESDFINFIKIVPINDDYHLKVHSPILRDIIIRSCVEIELFLKEWAKYECSANKDSELLESYNKIDKRTKKIRGAKNWNFPDYFILREKYNFNRPLFVRPLGLKINVFEQWKERMELPKFWNAYNSIKHDGINSQKQANLENALYALAALFSLHCLNNYSRSYLREFCNISTSHSSSKLKVSKSEITTPLDSKRYLFRDIYSFSGRGFVIDTSNDHEKRSTGKGRSV